jgi:predicted  nucleic acid-binding Zn-ribbon protein
MSEDDQGLRERVTRQGEETIGKLAQELLENPVVSRALTAAFETRERAARAQEVAMGALNLPSASDVERLTRRLRGVSQRLEGIEDGLDRLEQGVERLDAATALDKRLTAIEERLGRIESAIESTPSSPPDDSSSREESSEESGPSSSEATG